MRLSVLFLILLLVASSFFGCAESSPAEFKVTNFRDIPNITEEEIAAVEALKESYGKFSFGQMHETEAFLLPDGTHAGFSAELCDLLSQLFEIEFDLEIHAWNPLIKGFDSKQIDFTGDLIPTPQRQKMYFMSHPIAERSLKLFILKDNDSIHTEADLNGLNVGSLSGTINAVTVRERYPGLNFRQVDIPDIEGAVQQLRLGTLDAFFTEGVIAPQFDQYDDIKAIDFFPLAYTPVSLSTANPDLKVIISVFDKYITSGGVDVLFDLYKRGDAAYARYRLGSSYTDEEKAYIDELISNNKTVKVALETDNYPVSFYNNADKEFQGIAVEVLAEISELTGIKFEVANDEKANWPDLFSMLESGEVSLVTQLIHSEERAGHYLWPEIPYTSTNYALISRNDYPALAIYQIVRAKVGAVSRTAYEDNYREWLPENDNLICYDSQREALEALEKGEIDLVMGSSYLLLSQQNYREKPGFKINVLFETKAESYFGLNINEPVLTSIIDKAQYYVNTEIIQRYWESYTFDYSVKLAQQQSLFFMIFTIITTLALSLTIFLLYTNRKLAVGLDKTVKERTYELEQRTIELERQTEAAQVAAKAKGTFLANMSHEIRTPLNAIIGMAGIAKRSVSNPEKSLTSIDQIITSSHHLLGILNDVLDMSKIDTGKLELAVESFGSRNAYKEVEAIIEQRCRDRRIKFVTNVNDLPDMNIIADKLRLNQVIINLLGNAIKFTHEGGEVKFWIDVTEEDDESIKILFTISDTGIGISEKQMTKLFTPFEQADRSILNKYGGTGLGLSISQTIIGLMGGVIKVESTLGIGSKFYFELSFPKGETAPETEETVEIVNLAGKRILIVEDVDINRVIVREILELTGAEIDEAENGLYAVEMFADSSEGYYDLIFMDIQMPLMNGYDATEAIRSIDRGDAKTVPIVAMSANAFKEDIDAALESGMNDHVSKPINEYTVMAVLKKYIHDSPAHSV